jgi:CheY-like chemotaxis protein/HPt (histidine-containing phosphotransfer) domain-containing protein
VVQNGGEAIEAAARCDYDIILVDVEMPDLAGCETARQIRQNEKEGRCRTKKPVYIVAMTWKITAADHERCLAAGMNDYVSKPVCPAELEAALVRWAGNVSFEKTETWLAGAGRLIDPHAASGADFDSSLEEAGALVDLDRLTDIALGDPTELRGLVEFYFSQSDEMIAQLESAVRSRSAPDVRAAAHKFAGSSATCGMVVVAKYLRELERQAEAKVLRDASALLGKVQRSFEQTRQFMGRYLQSLPAETSKAGPGRVELSQK